MMDFLAAAHAWIKALHIASVIAWMAGLFYLPRLFAYHAERAAPGSEMSETFKVMERRLLKIIMNPAMIATWSFGTLLVINLGISHLFTEIWFVVKFAAISALTWFHHLLVRWELSFRADANGHDARFYRRVNEVPTVLMLVIVIMVVVRPF